MDNFYGSNLNRFTLNFKIWKCRSTANLLIFIYTAHYVNNIFYGTLIIFILLVMYQ